MKQEDLTALLRTRSHSDAFSFHRLFFDGLIQHGWAFQALSINPDRYADLQTLMRAWIADAPLNDDSDEMRLMAARNGLRRLSYAMETSLAQIVSVALSWPQDKQFDSLSATQRHKLALLADAEMLARFDLLTWSRSEPRSAMLFAINALDDTPASPNRLLRLNQIADTIPSLPLIDLPPAMLSLLYRVCFKCSYLTSENRYHAKCRLVELAQYLYSQHSIAVESLPSQSGSMTLPDKPALLIVGEGFQPGHAMYRFFSGMISELRGYFTITLMTEQRQQHQDQQHYADKIIYLEPAPRPVEQWAAQIREQHPDIIFYPSVGMSFATFTLSLLRLAPLQVASLGHPAPSCSPCIDATLIFDEIIPPADLPEPLFYNRHHLTPALPDWKITPTPNKHEFPCIGINASMIKLNADFLNTIREIVQDYAKPCRLCFFPNVAGLEWQGLVLMINAIFPTAEIFFSVDHIHYMQQLLGCDLVLQSYPFGGANTTTDALDCGIPVLGLRGKSMAGQTDAVLLNARGLSDLCVDDIDSYKKMALRLLRDVDFRADVRQRILNAGDYAGMHKDGAITASDALYRHWKKVNQHD